MRVAIAVGGDALLRRKQVATAQNQLDNVRVATRGLAAVAAQARADRGPRQRPAGRAAGVAGRGLRQGRRRAGLSAGHARRRERPLHAADRATALRRERGWTLARDGDGWRRVVPSPAARAIVDARPIGWLLERGAVVICGGGGGIPVVRDARAVARAAAIGPLDRIEALLAGDAGTAVLPV
jgi:carbamate kinase